MFALDALNKSNLASVLFSGNKKRKRPATPAKKAPAVPKQSTADWWSQQLPKLQAVSAQEPAVKKSKPVQDPQAPKKVKKPKKLQSSLDLNMKAKKRWPLSRLQLTMRQWTEQEIWGIDMSLTNPGLTHLNPMKKTISMYFLRNRKMEHSGAITVDHTASPFHGWRVHVELIERLTPEQTSDLFSDIPVYRFRGYFNVVKQLMGVIRTNSSGRTLVGIEHYSFMSQNTNATSTLIELGALLRAVLVTEGHNLLEIPPSTIKNMFSDSGRANKDVMTEAYNDYFHMPSMFPLIGLDPGRYTKTPHPVEDMVDSFAVALTTFCLLKPH